jgi:hypothetical protein
LIEWEEALQNFSKLPSLQSLQSFLYGGSHIENSQWHEVGITPRPRREAKGNEDMEGKHRKLFELFGTVRVPDLTLKFTWNPEDILSQQEWPFTPDLQTVGEVSKAIDELPEKTVVYLYA